MQPAELHVYGDRVSPGMAAEIVEARRMGIPVVVKGQALGAWEDVSRAIAALTTTADGTGEKG